MSADRAGSRAPRPQPRGPPRRTGRRPRAPRALQRTGSSGCCWPCFSRRPPCAFNRLPGTQDGEWAVLASFLLAPGVVVLASLNVIQPGQTAGRPVLRPLHRHRPAHRAGLGPAAADPPRGVGPGPQLRDEHPQGQRRRRQSGRDRRDRGMAGRRHREGACSPWRTTALRRHPGRGRVAARRGEPPLRRPDERGHDAARLHRRGRRATRRGGRRSGSHRRRGDHRGRGSATSRTRRRSPRRCCSDSRPARSSPPAPGSSRAPSAWSRWRWTGSAAAASSTSTRNARPRWCPTCSSCCAATRGRSPWSTPGPCTMTDPSRPEPKPEGGHPVGRPRAPGRPETDAAQGRSAGTRRARARWARGRPAQHQRPRGMAAPPGRHQHQAACADLDPPALLPTIKEFVGTEVTAEVRRVIPKNSLIPGIPPIRRIP